MKLKALNSSHDYCGILARPCIWRENIWKWQWWGQHYMQNVVGNESLTKISSAFIKSVICHIFTVVCLSSLSLRI